MDVTIESPAHVCALAIELEEHCCLLYEEWARRFKPYDKEVSKLFAGLAEEERDHARQFRALLEEVATSTRPTISTLPAGFNDCLKRLQIIQDHFFVTGPVMDSTILESALETEFFTRKLYEELEDSAGNVAIAAVCRHLGRIEEEHVQSLLEHLESEQRKLAEV